MSATTYPTVAPTVVPMMPMIKPCIMKTVVMLRALAPMVFKIPMSRCFSITRRISDATMFNAATITMRKMVIEIAIFSSHSASNSDRF